MPPRARQSKAPRSNVSGDGERLQKALAAAGVGSRRKCESLIVEGRVQIDGRVVTELGTKVDRVKQEIRVDGEPLARPRLVHYMVHKPTGVLSTSRDPSGRPRVIDLLPPEAGRLFSVGRLDMSSEGLILVTNDGELAQRLTHPRYGVSKTYQVEVAGHPEPQVLADLRQGVRLAEGWARADEVRVKARHKQSTILEIVLKEGRNREIRRLLARTGHKVERLKRVAVGPLRLGDLPPGAYRPLTREETKALTNAAGREQVSKGPGGRLRRRTSEQESKRTSEQASRRTGERKPREGEAPAEPPAAKVSRRAGARKRKAPAEPKGRPRTKGTKTARRKSGKGRRR